MTSRTPVVTLPGFWRFRRSAWTGWPCVSILWLGEISSLISNFYLSVAARTGALCQYIVTRWDIKFDQLTSISVWQHAHLSDNIRPCDTLVMLSKQASKQQHQWLARRMLPTHSVKTRHFPQTMDEGDACCRIDNSAFRPGLYLRKSWLSSLATREACVPSYNYQSLKCNVLKLEFLHSWVQQLTRMTFVNLAFERFVCRHIITKFWSVTY